jgi:hypothetical protein
MAMIAFVEVELQRVLSDAEFGEKIRNEVIRRDFDKSVRAQEMEPGVGGALAEYAFESEAVKR